MQTKRVESCKDDVCQKGGVVHIATHLACLLCRTRRSERACRKRSDLLTAPPAVRQGAACRGAACRRTPDRARGGRACRRGAGGSPPAERVRARWRTHDFSICSLRLLSHRGPWHRRPCIASDDSLGCSFGHPWISSRRPRMRAVARRALRLRQTGWRRRRARVHFTPSACCAGSHLARHTRSLRAFFMPSRRRICSLFSSSMPLAVCHLLAPVDGASHDETA